MQGLTMVHTRKADVAQQQVTIYPAGAIDLHRGHHGQGHAPLWRHPMSKNMHLHSTLTYTHKQRTTPAAASYLLGTPLRERIPKSSSLHVSPICLLFG